MESGICTRARAAVPSHSRYAGLKLHEASVPGTLFARDNYFQISSTKYPNLSNIRTPLAMSFIPLALFHFCGLALLLTPKEKPEAVRYRPYRNKECYVILKEPV